MDGKNTEKDNLIDRENSLSTKDTARVIEDVNKVF